ncbi:TPA: hypothetical protein N2D10_003033 [Clostridium botulinum]|nr:hypothetical protein [Clostridium botulinum]
MVIKKWTGCKEVYKLKKIYKYKVKCGGGVDMMTPVLDLNTIKESKSFNPSIQIPFIDMVFDKEKRQAVYKKYDRKYEENEDEEEIFKQMTARRLKKGE